MRILLIHERYREAGGEDVAVEAEQALLESAGFTVATVLEDNRRIDGEGSLRLALRALWSPEARRRTAAEIDRFRPDVVHVHNTFPLLSPSVYGAARARGVPVVQVLHNYRMACANALLLREGRNCEVCVGRRLKWPGVVHACYRDSVAASAAVVAVGLANRTVGITLRGVDRFVALSAFARNKLIADGAPAERLIVCPPVVPDPPPDIGIGARRAGALFVGRLSPEKGVEDLVAAWRDVPHPLTVVGEGPLEETLRRAAGPNTRFTGRLERAAVVEAMRHAALLVFPSLCGEAFGLVVAEALACGLPVLARSGGAAADLVEDSVSGALVPPGDKAAWRQRACELLDNPEMQARMGIAARARYDALLAPPQALERRRALYAELLAVRRR